MTPWDDIFNLFFLEVAKSKQFWSYYNVGENEAMELARRLAREFLLASIDKIMLLCEPDVDFGDYDPLLEQFNFQLTTVEKSILVRFMLEAYFEKDLAKLTVMTNVLSSQDLKYAFSGWHERNSFMAMLSELQKDNLVRLKRYAGRDRLSGSRKFISYE